MQLSRKTVKVIVCLAMATLLLPTGTSALAQETREHVSYRIRTDGTNEEVLRANWSWYHDQSYFWLTNRNNHHVAFDFTGDRSFESTMRDDQSHRFYRANLDGSDEERIAYMNTGCCVPDRPGPIALDPESATAYWVVQEWHGDRQYHLHAVDMNGSDEGWPVTSDEPSLFSIGWVDDIELDAVEGKLYACSGNITRRNLDGSGFETLVSDSGVKDIALDLVNDKLYWLTATSIFSANLNGTNAQSFEIPDWGGSTPVELAVDSVDEKVYWSLYSAIDPGVHGLSGTIPLIQRANLDGTSVEDFVERDYSINPLETASFIARDIAVDTQGGSVYWLQSSEVVPEPATLSLLALGGPLAARHRREGS